MESNEATMIIELLTGTLSAAAATRNDGECEALYQFAGALVSELTVDEMTLAAVRAVMNMSVEDLEYGLNYLGFSLRKELPVASEVA